MNTNWQNFLGAFGAVIEDNYIPHFGNAVAETSAMAESDTLSDLSQLAIVEVTGADAEAFLQGQFSNDIKHVDTGHTQLSAYCTPKGRMLAIFRIWKYGDSYLLTLPISLAESIISRLRMYVLRSQVKLELAENLIHIGIAGPNAISLIKKTFEISLDETGACSSKGDILVTRVAGVVPRYEVIGPEPELEILWQQWSVEAKLAGASAWDWQDITSGIPKVTPATSEAFVPQMANLDLLNGISFKKGCYPGQEIVARTKYLGKLKQRMYRARVHADKIPKSGEPLFAPNFSDQTAGKVVSAQLGPDNIIDLLVVAQISSVENGEMTLGSVDGPKLEFVPLPYEIPTAS